MNWTDYSRVRVKFSISKDFALRYESMEQAYLSNVEGGHSRRASSNIALSLSILKTKTLTKHTFKVFSVFTSVVFVIAREKEVA